MKPSKSSRNINTRLEGQAYLRLSDRLGNAMRRSADASFRIENPAGSLQPLAADVLLRTLLETIALGLVDRP